MPVYENAFRSDRLRAFQDTTLGAYKNYAELLLDDGRTDDEAFEKKRQFYVRKKHLNHIFFSRNVLKFA